MTVQLTDLFCAVDGSSSDVRPTDHMWSDAVAALGYGRGPVAAMTVAAARGRLVSAVLDLVAAQDSDAYDRHAQHVADAARTLTHSVDAAVSQFRVSSR